jgi:hypothetical protein
MAKGKKKVKKKIRRKSRREEETGRGHNTIKKLTLGSSSSFQELDTFGAQRDEFLHQNLSKGSMSRKVQAMNKAKHQD